MLGAHGGEKPMILEPENIWWCFYRNGGGGDGGQEKVRER
jgi:hypothetical protein